MTDQQSLHPLPAQTPPDQDLVVRQHERFTCRISADVRIADSDHQNVRVSRLAAGPGGGVPATIVDLSRGGLGLDCGLFLPRSCRLRVGVSLPGAETLWVDGVVRRSTMISRDPRYYIGLSFTDQSAAAIDRLMAVSGAAA